MEESLESIANKNGSFEALRRYLAYSTFYWDENGKQIHILISLVLYFRHTRENSHTLPLDRLSKRRIKEHLIH